MILTRKSLLFFKKTSFIFFYSSFRGVKLTFYSKPLNDITFIDSLMLKKSSKHSLYNESNLSSKPLFFLLGQDQENDNISKECNEYFKTIKQKFELLKSSYYKDNSINSNINSLIKDIKMLQTPYEIDKTLPILIEKNQVVLQPYLKLFQDIKQNVFSVILKLEKMEVQKKNRAFVCNLAGITTLCIFLNIIDLELWQKVVSLTLNNIDIMEESNSFHIITSNILEILNLFRFRANDTTLSFHNLFYYEEKEMISILNKNHFRKIFEKLEKSFNKCFQKPDFFLLDELCSNYNQICLLAIKFLRIQSLDYVQIRIFAYNLKKIIFNDIEKLSIKNSLIFYKNFGYFGYNDKELMKRFEHHFVKNLENLEKEDEQIVLRSLLSSWRSNGEYNLVLYEKYMRPRLLKIIVNGSSKKLSTLTSLFYDLACIKVDDFEIFKKILDSFEIFEIENAPLFNKKSLHCALQYLLGWKTIHFDLKPYKELIDKLSIFCINQNYNQISPEINQNQFNESPFFQQLQLIDCCNVSTIKIFRNPIHKSSDLQEKDQKNNPSFQEKKIISAIKDNLINNFTEKVKFFIDYQVCLYKIDVAFFFLDKGEKVALEICGKPYGLENGNFSGKKQMKFQLLEKLGWKIVYFEISEGKYFNMLARFSKAVSIEFAEEILKKLEVVLERKLEIRKNNQNFISEKEQKKEIKYFKQGFDKKFSCKK